MTAPLPAFDAHDCVHDLFERQAGRTPDADAVIFESQTLSYAALNTRANQIATFLRNIGVGPDVRVALCMERTFDLVIGILAILKAGGAYAPLDPSHPGERLRNLLQDCRPALILSHEAARQTVRRALGGWSEAPPVVDVGEIAADVAADNPDRLVFGLRATHLAYVIYTSGSTGRPKGVMVEHRNVVNLLADMAARLTLTPGAVAPAITPISFDIAGLELLLPLSVGQAILLLPRHVSRDPFALKRALDRDDLAFVQATPSTWRGLIDAGWRARGAPILCGGETLPAPLALRLIERDAKLWNVYGPTETTIWSSAALLSQGEPIVIGRPIANTRIYVLDERLRPVPPGVGGEIYIGGAGVARGYFNRPDLTAERFIASPFVEGDRLYCTGDRGRYGDDGDLEFLGRTDSQVKVRGARIELGEIEAHLARDPQVSQSAVVVRRDRSGANTLVAYLAPADGARPDPVDVRRRLAARLPEYMLPDLCIVLDRFPLTPNGKVDRNALPAAVLDAAEADEPIDDVEEMIARLWADVLGAKMIGRHDSFFDLGGNSMLMIAVAMKIQEMLGVEIDMQAFFAEPTMACLSSQASRVAKTSAPSSATA